MGAKTKFGGRIGSAVFLTAASLILPLPTGRASAATKVGSACRAVMGGSFLQPSSAVFGWSAARYDQELRDMRGVGITSVIDQWTGDMDAKRSYYVSLGGVYPTGPDMVGSLMASAGRQHSSVWLGLGNVYDWQSHATDAAWLQNQLDVDERIADQLWALYPGRIAGWYISNEVNDVLLATPAAIGPMTSFFTSLANYLHTHDGNLEVMASPTYSGLHQSVTQFAQSTKSVLGALDVLNVQDGGGSGYIGPSDITNWFSALSAVLAGTHTALWQDADMYSSPSGPMPPARLQADLKATCGYAVARTGFSFTTQMGPADLGTRTYYDAYKTYASAA